MAWPFRGRLIANLVKAKEQGWEADDFGAAPENRERSRSQRTEYGSGAGAKRV